MKIIELRVVLITLRDLLSRKRLYPTRPDSISFFVRKTRRSSSRNFVQISRSLHTMKNEKTATTAECFILPRRSLAAREGRGEGVLTNEGVTCKTALSRISENTALYRSADDRR